MADETSYTDGPLPKMSGVTASHASQAFWGFSLPLFGRTAGGSITNHFRNVCLSSWPRQVLPGWRRKMIQSQPPTPRWCAVSALSTRLYCPPFFSRSLSFDGRVRRRLLGLLASRKVGCHATSWPRSWPGEDPRLEYMESRPPARRLVMQVTNLQKLFVC